MILKKSGNILNNNRLCFLILHKLTSAISSGSDKRFLLLVLKLELTPIIETDLLKRERFCVHVVNDFTFVQTLISVL